MPEARCACKLARVGSGWVGVKVSVGFVQSIVPATGLAPSATWKLVASMLVQSRRSEKVAEMVVPTLGLPVDPASGLTLWTVSGAPATTVRTAPALTTAPPAFQTTTEYVTGACP